MSTEVKQKKDVKVHSENNRDYSMLEKIAKELNGRPWAPGILKGDSNIIVSDLPKKLLGDDSDVLEE